jgi:(p)ppGpp synthase/HD superfamily hydrolase
MLTTSEPPFLAGRPTARRALRWAGTMHRDQRRAVDGAPFILHPLEVGSLLSGRDFPEPVIVAGLLHDVVEKTDATLADVRSMFGDRVARIVDAVTEDGEIEGYTERKAELRRHVAEGDGEAHAVYLADKIAKARELRAQTARGSPRLEEPELRRRLEHYEASLAMLRDVAGHQGMMDQLAFELWALRALPPKEPGGPDAREGDLAAGRG